MELLISILCLILAAACKALAESCAHGKSRFSNDEIDFFGGNSSVRKYKNLFKGKTLFFPSEHPNNWYYRNWKIKYKERFPGSATIFVSLTDAYHLAFSLMVTFCVIAVSVWTPWPLYFFLAARISWGIFFSLAYKILSK